ncbi:MAG TPA: T9SS type A sorting domain-containing protein, partial [Chryseolinea sp.]|nr:T9SS type A sorting domain-containing protein [Chryseolinea sp.]
YVSCGVGSGGVYFNDLLSFDPATAVWTRLAPLPGTTRRYPVGFSINGKGYVGGGYRGFWGLFDPTKPTYYFDFYEYSPTTNQWVSKTNVPSMSDDAVMSIAEGLYVSTCDKGYAIGGRKTNSASAFPTNKISIYNVINNTWSSFTNAQTASYKGAGWIVNGYLSVGLTGSASPGGEKIYFYELHQISMLPEICTTGQIALLTQPTNSSTSWVSNNTSALTISPNTGNSVTGYRMNGYNNEVTFTATMTSANGCSAIRTKSIWLGAPLIISQTLDGGTYYPGIGICPGNHYLNVTPKGGNASNAAWTVQAGVPYVTGTNTMNFTMNTSVTSIAITARSSNSCGQGANSSFYLSKKTFGCPSSFSLVIFPNPAEEDLTIEIVPDQSADNKGSEALVISDAVLVNMDGGIVATSGAAEGKTKLNVRGLKKGQYFLHVNVHGEIFKEQIVIR